MIFFCKFIFVLILRFGKVRVHYKVFFGIFINFKLYVISESLLVNLVHFYFIFSVFVNGLNFRLFAEKYNLGSFIPKSNVEW